MTKEEKQLLLKDLCARLPYGYIRCKWIVESFNPDTFDKELEINEVIISFIEPNKNSVHLYGKEVPVDIGEIKPYLRPMSSMTEEEKMQLKEEHLKDTRLFAESLTKAAAGDTSMRGKVIPHFAADWCNKNHFDFRGLIPMGLALEATEGMY